MAALLLLAASLLPPAHALDLDHRVRFDIPAQRLSSALIQFSHQAKIQVVSASDVGNLTTKGIAGSHAIRDALAQLLDASGLGYRVVSETSITIGKKTEADADKPSMQPASAGAPLAMARVETTAAPERTPASAAGSDAPQSGEVTVTGSRIRGAAGEATIQPVFVYTRADRAREQPWRGTGQAFWLDGGWEYGVIATYSSGYEDMWETPYDRVALWDFQVARDFARASWRPSGWIKHLAEDARVSLNLINAFNKEPQIYFGSSLGTEDPRGRRYQLSYQKQF